MITTPRTLIHITTNRHINKQRNIEQHKQYTTDDTQGTMKDTTKYKERETTII